jgi:hypothetical protein
LTINKAQGLGLKRVAIYPLSPVLSHGKLYVTFSPRSSFDHLAVAIIGEHHQYKENDRPITSNILYRELL